MSEKMTIKEYFGLEEPNYEEITRESDTLKITYVLGENNEANIIAINGKPVDKFDWELKGPYNSYLDITDYVIDYIYEELPWLESEKHPIIISCNVEVNITCDIIGYIDYYSDDSGDFEFDEDGTIRSLKITAKCDDESVKVNEGLIKIHEDIKDGYQEITSFEDFKNIPHDDVWEEAGVEETINNYLSNGYKIYWDKDKELLYFKHPDRFGEIMPKPRRINNRKKINPDVLKIVYSSIDKLIDSYKDDRDMLDDFLAYPFDPENGIQFSWEENPEFEEYLDYYYDNEDRIKKSALKYFKAKINKLSENKKTTNESLTDDGWSDEVVDILEPPIEEIEELHYELKNTVRGAKTNAKTVGQLVNHCEQIMAEFDDAISELDHKSDELNEKLIQSDSDKAFKKNVATEIKAGKDPKQAVAIAYSVKRKNEDINEAEYIAPKYKDGDLVFIGDAQGYDGACLVHGDISKIPQEAYKAIRRITKWGNIPDLYRMETKLQSEHHFEDDWKNFYDWIDGVFQSSGIEILKGGEQEAVRRFGESLNEAKKPKYYDTAFGQNVIKDFESGKLTLKNIPEWDKAYNGGKIPNPPFNTKQIIDYYLATKKENDMKKEKVTEGLLFRENGAGLADKGYLFTLQELGKIYDDSVKAKDPVVMEYKNFSDWMNDTIESGLLEIVDERAFDESLNESKSVLKIKDVTLYNGKYGKIVQDTDPQGGTVKLLYNKNGDLVTKLQPYQYLGKSNKDLIDTYLKNESLNEADELDRKGFTTIVKLGDYPYDGYSILNDGYFVKRIYSESDEDAVKQFRDWLERKDESLNESKGLSGNEIDNFTGSLLRGKRYSELSDEEKKLYQELSCRSMINSILAYTKIDWNGDRPSAKEIVDAQDKQYKNYLKEYIDIFGKDRVIELVQEQMDRIEDVDWDTDTDSEGLSYNSIRYKESLDESQHPSAKYGVQPTGNIKKFYIEWETDDDIGWRWTTVMAEDEEHAERILRNHGVANKIKEISEIKSTVKESIDDIPNWFKSLYYEAKEKYGNDRASQLRYITTHSSDDHTNTVKWLNRLRANDSKSIVWDRGSLSGKRQSVKESYNISDEDFQQKLKNELQGKLQHHYKKFGYTQREIEDYIMPVYKTEFRKGYGDDGSDALFIWVGAEVDYEELEEELAPILNKVIQKYDKDAYFEPETAGRLIAVLWGDGTNESLNESDEEWHDTADREQADEPDYIPDEIDRYEAIAHKTVYDSDGFTTDYTLYFDHDENNYFTVFGDNDLYGPEDSDHDWDFGPNEDEAFEWFEDYEGFVDDDDVDLELTDDDLEAGQWYE